MTKTLKFVSCIILFFSLFLTAKAVPNQDPIYIIECNVHKDCDVIFTYAEFTAEDVKFLKTRWEVMCKNGICHYIPAV
jgi:hypothetical protein